MERARRGCSRRAHGPASLASRAEADWPTPLLLTNARAFTFRISWTGRRVTAPRTACPAFRGEDAPADPSGTNAVATTVMRMRTNGMDDLRRTRPMKRLPPRLRILVVSWASPTRMDGYPPRVNRMQAFQREKVGPSPASVKV